MINSDRSTTTTTKYSVQSVTVITSSHNTVLVSLRCVSFVLVIYCLALLCICIAPGCNVYLLYYIECIWNDNNLT